jgi:putative flippase GtrA
LIAASKHEALKFAIVGSIGFVVDACLLTLFARVLEIPIYLARVMSFFFAVVVTGTLNRKVTFSNRFPAERAAGSAYLRYLGVQISGATLNYLVFVAALWVRPGWISFPTIPLAMASLVAMIFNFLGSRYFAFANDSSL